MEKINLRIVLYQPEIPANTGNIGRLCVGINAALHIIKPMRFMISDKYLKRAGLDYWEKLSLYFHENLAELYQKFPQNNFYYCTKKSDKHYIENEYKKGDFFIFGPESSGIPEKILKENWNETIKIPMSNNIRSYNLANSVAIISFEALRQLSFPM